jgi:hypothetical protein
MNQKLNSKSDGVVKSCAQNWKTHHIGFTYDWVLLFQRESRNENMGKHSLMELHMVLIAMSWLVMSVRKGFWTWPLRQPPDHVTQVTMLVDTCLWYIIRFTCIVSQIVQERITRACLSRSSVYGPLHQPQRHCDLPDLQISSPDSALGHADHAHSWEQSRERVQRLWRSESVILKRFWGDLQNTPI